MCKYFTTNTVLFVEPPAMPLRTPAPLNKRKKLTKIITDLSHVTQDGKTVRNIHKCKTTFSIYSSSFMQGQKIGTVGTDLQDKKGFV